MQPTRDSYPERYTGSTQCTATLCDEAPTTPPSCPARGGSQKQGATLVELGMKTRSEPETPGVSPRVYRRIVQPTRNARTEPSLTQLPHDLAATNKRYLTTMVGLVDPAAYVGADAKRTSTALPSMTRFERVGGATQMGRLTREGREEKRSAEDARVRHGRRGRWRLSGSRGGRHWRRGTSGRRRHWGRWA